MAADSLTSTRGVVKSCQTSKLHRISNGAVVAACGLARVLNRPWSEILEQFSAPTDSSPTQLASELKTFLDQEISRVARNNFGACSGGNTFIVVVDDPTGAHPVILSIERDGDDRKFKSPNTLNPAAGVRDHISWWGDTPKIEEYLTTRRATYQPEMEEAVAVAFAQETIRGAIAASASAGQTSIGGEFISVGVVRSTAGGEVTRNPTNMPCAISVPTPIFPTLDALELPPESTRK